ncbi:MAG: VWA domain-containing protein, partial [Myxococcales bacterium]|nr:VWA domain-containing protein [Myxococcales bacterium]
AVEELDLDVKRAERVCVLHGRVAVAHLAWLARMIRVTQRIAAALADEQRGERALAAIDPVLVAPPLAIAIHPSPPSEQKTEPDLAVDRAQTRLVELQLAAIDHIIDAAREETGQLERRRSLLEAARRLLLDADASLQLDAEGVRARKRYLAEQIVQVDRLEATGLSPRVGLVHQARSALARGDRHRLRSALCALEGFAVTAGDASLGERVARALDGVDGAADPFSQESRQQSLGRSAGELFGGRVLDAVDRAYAESEGSRRARYEEALSDSVEGAVDLALAYLDEGKREQALAAMIAVDGCFDVGAPLVPVRVRNTTITARLVRHPTQDLVLTRARGPEDVPNAVITDPRTVLLDLATGRLLSRRYVRYEPQIRERVEMVGEARIYLLDGSTSMLDEGRDMARARMRDAILMAELATSMERFEKGDRHTRVVLYFRYFTKRIGPVTRVSRPNEALAAMAQVLEEPHRGGTDIEGALAASFETIRQARGQDPSLAQAQIVLITDGRAEVRPSLVEKARAPVGDLPIAVSVIALGEENPALRDLVAEQRRRGERAFYHF